MYYRDSVLIQKSLNKNVKYVCKQRYMLLVVTFSHIEVLSKMWFKLKMITEVLNEEKIRKVEMLLILDGTSLGVH